MDKARTALARFDPQQLAAWSNGKWQSAILPTTISGFCFDARQLKPGECFVALSGGARDGHEFALQAVAGGAGSLLVERAQDLGVPQLLVEDSLLAMGAIGAGIRNGFINPVVGITGSCGKTSTKEMLRVLLGESRTHATAGNWNNRIGVPMTLFGLDAEPHDFAVIEAGINQPKEMAALGAMIEADLTIITNIASAHLELLGSLEGVAAEKSELVLHSRAHAPMVLPNSVFQYSAFTACAERALVLAVVDEVVSPEPKRVIRYRLDVAGVGQSTLQLSDGSTDELFQIASPSEGICVNAALAIVAARELGISNAVIRERLAAWEPASTRGRIATQGEQTLYIDCYNANPASMRDAIAAFGRSMPVEQARCYVLGAMNELGSDAIALHRKIGQQLRLRPEDRAFFVGPDVLTQAYYDGAIQAGSNPAQLTRSTDVEKIKSVVADFVGALFLKGSRSYALETLLPTTLG
ncbi:MULTISPECIES: UDP-N-acetylmuramoyl-tripeptide--D-alanyl-D-alanine ligase [unclassified Lentimonas]|uniref:UDP-N-acetylmuramoyl-tripeptide--D-alanyl-D- alanine ligase n=1 Tax=unclassified Lentimonas TaxID=2630993 RepID=UPI0013290E22|nr:MULTISPECIES: UDP-N-acetylmuramoyl-tripeptide--D-alanyl-D-alanine ligase [unclassified Lentimonas]CAA6678778.1 UDP-N-acetylmuramoylalanyl-D-glutamyl-2,6-diaminopimelate--D-alanyl-D-alanine ligase (EC [Lentimonas sp. CC4]CAA6684381.1 UDP-N-acetylmuramoylalanyl-D-glutamyl-2,6-diaminopimelate--D-alanyl-D-alanine ligase (EC [Lentimonas sp. CC6]CAA6692929.1 UDP-N-acetylmuramoylalanyl-D-glutamyl-2,6-diaminopimelate--D-alanyl-D-alanine ligase (EC [Lentimonas sp. CC19]CAA6695750.1 UDP-N-acetylmuramo